MYKSVTNGLLVYSHAKTDGLQWGGDEKGRSVYDVGDLVCVNMRRCNYTSLVTHVRYIVVNPCG